MDPSLTDDPAPIPGTHRYQAPLVNAVITATNQTMQEVVGLESRFDRADAAPVALQPKASGWISGASAMAGDGWWGQVSLHLPEILARRMVGSLLGIELASLGAQLLEGVCEMTHLVVAGARTSLGGQGWRFSLGQPLAVAGGDIHQAGLHPLLLFGFLSGEVRFRVGLLVLGGAPPATHLPSAGPSWT